MPGPELVLLLSTQPPHVFHFFVVCVFVPTLSLLDTFRYLDMNTLSINQQSIDRSICSTTPVHHQQQWKWKKMLPLPLLLLPSLCRPGAHTPSTSTKTTTTIMIIIMYTAYTQRDREGRPFVVIPQLIHASIFTMHSHHTHPQSSQPNYSYSYYSSFYFAIITNEYKTIGIVQSSALVIVDRQNANIRAHALDKTLIFAHRRGTTTSRPARSGEGGRGRGGGEKAPVREY